MNVNESPNNKTLAISKITQETFSQGILSVPEKYNAKHTGHMREAFINPNIVNVNAT